MSANTEITPWHLRVNGQDGIDSEDAMMAEINDLRAALEAANTRIEDLTTAANRCINDALVMGQQVAQRAGSGDAVHFYRIVGVDGAQWYETSAENIEGIKATKQPYQYEFRTLYTAPPAAVQPDSGRDAVIKVAPEPFILGNRYRTQGGRFVRFVGVANEGTSYETMYDELGHHRYTKRDFGRCTGASWDDDCVPPLYTYPSIQPQVSNKL